MADTGSISVYVRGIGTARLSSELTAGTVDGQAAVLSGRSSVGDGGEGLAVWDAASTATADDATVWGSGTGRWKRAMDGLVLNVRWFGAHPTASAATNGAAINAAIAQAVATNVRRVHIPAGIYNIDRTIYLGGTLRFTCLELSGDGYAVNGESSYGGTTLIPNFSNAPCVNVQGGRGSVVRDMTLRGLNYDHVVDNLMGVIGTPLVVDTVAANWWDGLLSASGNTRYAPYAGVAIDGWAGSAPGTAYPTTYTAYGQNFSSDVMIENCQITGFNTAVAVQPCDEDGNGDFTVVRRCLLDACVWGVSVGNTQSRQVGLQDVKVSRMYCALTNNQHGRQQGKFNGTVDNMSLGSVVMMFEFGSATYFGPIRFVCCYGESIWRLGNYAATVANEQGMSFDECAFNFHLQDDTRGIPATVLSGGQQTSLIKFSGTSFLSYPSVLVFDHLGVVFDRALFASIDREVSVAKTYMAHFHNATCDGLIMQLGTTKEDHRVKFSQINVDTLVTNAGNVVAQRGMRNSDRKRGIPLCVQTVGSKDDDYNDEQYVYRRGYGIDKSALSSCTLVNSVLTVVFAAATAADAENYGFAAGDMLVDDETHTVFAVRSFDDGTNTLVAEIQNNYTLSGSTYTPITTFNTGTGNFYARNCRLYSPTYPVLADITSASAVLASTGRDDGYSAFIDTAGTPDAIKVDDRVLIPETHDSWVSATSNKVTAIASGGGSITLAGAAARTLSRKRLPVWIRKPPANEGSR
jgi:hypothetical protein